MKTLLQVTFNTLKSYHACQDGYVRLSKSLGGDEIYGLDTLINVLTILERNGLEDAIWALRATLQSSDKVCRLFAADCAESVLHIFEEKYPDDMRPRNAIQAARDFANGLIGIDELKDAASAAMAASAANAAWAARGASAAWAASAASAASAAMAAMAVNAVSAVSTVRAARAARAAKAARAASAAWFAWDASAAENTKQVQSLKKYLME